MDCSHIAPGSVVLVRGIPDSERTTYKAVYRGKVADLYAPSHLPGYCLSHPHFKHVIEVSPDAPPKAWHFGHTCSGLYDATDKRGFYARDEHIVSVQSTPFNDIDISEVI